MKVCFVNNTKCESFDKKNCENAEVIVFGFGGIEELNYKRELRGETEELVKIGRLSKETGSIVIAGTITDNYGTKKMSAVVADKGKIVGIADMNSKNPNGEYTSGGGFKIITTQIGKIGILIGDDIFIPEAVKSMSLCETDLIVGLYGGLSDYKPNILMRAYSILYGVPMCMCSNKISFATNINGDIIFSSPKNVCVLDIPTKKVYREITTRQRGVNFD